MTKIAPLLKITNGANTMTITNEAPLALIWILNDAIAQQVRMIRHIIRHILHVRTRDLVGTFSKTLNDDIV